MFGDSPIAIPNSYENTKFPAIENKMEILIRNREEALAAHKSARTRMIDRRRSTYIPFKKGDRVWLDTRNLKTNHHKKIAPKREGPFEITKVIGPVTYQLNLPNTWKIHNVFHAGLLRQYRETEVYGANFQRPLPEVIEGEEVYEVETILKHRKRGRGHQYYVKWKGYPITEASWEPEHVFSNDGDLLTCYKKRHQL
jgi:Chromo (CHRromatin Organisation MOdifier) domain